MNQAFTGLGSAALVLSLCVCQCSSSRGTLATGDGGAAADVHGGVDGDFRIDSSSTGSIGVPGGEGPTPTADAGDGSVALDGQAQRDGAPATPDAAVPDAMGDQSAPPAYCASDPWMGLEACGWPGASNTGPDVSQCPGGALTTMGSSSDPTEVFEIGSAGTVIRCAMVYGELHITAQNVVVENSYVSFNSGKTGVDANGTAPIVVDDGASATVDHVEINGLDAVHACIWNQGQAPANGFSLAAHYVNCYGVDDGIFSWADTAFSATTGDNFVIDHSYFHDFTHATSNGHEDGFQTEGASNGLIQHNTYMLTPDADSCVAIWDSLKTSDNIEVEDNLMEGGGAAVYADDYSPSESSPQGGYAVTHMSFVNNVFSNHVAPCVGQYFAWYTRPAEPYQGGPTDGWQRSGNYVLETGENLDNGNPHVNGQLCQ